jgi:hypothetical protein
LSTPKRIALVTTWYTPIQSVASLRMNAFAEYLSESNEVVVYTLSDSKNEIEVDNQITIHRFTSSKLLGVLKSNTSDSKMKHKFKTAMRLLVSIFIRKPLNNWLKKVIDQLEKDHNQNNFDCIISSFAPTEAHEVALEIKKRHPSIFWIADMRDEMSGNAHVSEGSRKKFRVHENNINRFADAITTVSEPIVQSFKILCPKVSPIIEIQNGFNHKISPRRVDKGSCIKIGYFGTFYGSRKPNTFFQAWEKLSHVNNSLHLEFHLIGAHSNFSIPEWAKESVFLHSALPYEKAIEEMSKMHVNLLIHPRTEMKGVYTGKLYDYLSVCRPVLALVDKEDVAAKLINELNGGYIAEFSDVEEIYIQLQAIVSDWERNQFQTPAHQDVLKLHRKEGVKKLNQLIDQLCSQ